MSSRFNNETNVYWAWINRFLATASVDKTVKLWELNEEKGLLLYETLYGHSKWVCCDSKLLLTDSTDGWQYQNLDSRNRWSC